MKVNSLMAPAVLSGFIALLIGCASSEVDKYTAADPTEIIADILVQPSEGDVSLLLIKAPAIDVRAGYGAFATGMFRGGSNFGSSVYLQGRELAGGGVAHELIAAIQYTNLGGAYRNYDRAGIEGEENLMLRAVDRHKQFTPNAVIMTETVAVDIGDSLLAEKAKTGLTLRVGTDSGNLESLEIPANYIAAYLSVIETRGNRQLVQ